MGVHTPQRKLSPNQMYGPPPPHIQGPPAPMFEKPHTLREYSKDHFRSPRTSPKTSVVGGPLPRAPPSLALWRHSVLPLTEPLLKRLLDKDELAHQAVVVFHNLLMYMGDLPGRQTRLGLDLTDTIFDGPLKQVKMFYL